jgi:hypothetical protein
MSYYTKKPIPVLCHQWHMNGDHPEDFSDRDNGNGSMTREGIVVRRFNRPDVSGFSVCKHCRKEMRAHGWIDTLEGGHIVCPGDWIITGVRGERYPCKPDIFAETYQPASATAVEVTEEQVEAVCASLHSGVSLSGNTIWFNMADYNKDAWRKNMRAALAAGLGKGRRG